MASDCILPPTSTDCLETSNVPNSNHQRKRKSSMPASAAKNNAETSNDKSQTSSKPPIPISSSMKSSKMLAPASTVSGVASKPFWNAYTKEKSERSWYSTRTDFVGLDTELVEWIFAKAGVKLVVLGADLASQPDDAAREQQELADDLLSIVTVFVAKHNGRRSATNRKCQKEEAKATARSARKAKKSRREEGQHACSSSSSGEESQDGEEAEKGQASGGSSEEDSSVSDA
jgi:hypothetical protein